MIADRAKRTAEAPAVELIDAGPAPATPEACTALTTHSTITASRSPGALKVTARSDLCEDASR